MFHGARTTMRRGPRRSDGGASRASPGDRGVVVAFWSGEELGLLGSTDFVRRPVLAPESLAACLNFDMVVRRARQQAGGAGHGIEPGVARTGEPTCRSDSIFQLQDDPQLPTDSASFDRAGVPCLNFFTGGHEDYHRPSDTPEKLNYEDLDRVVDLATNVGRRLIGAAEPRVHQGRAQGRARPRARSVRAFTGTIPDYTAEVEGLKLAGVIAGGPAEQAGLAEGDVLVEFGGARSRTSTTTPMRSKQ